MSRTNIGHGTTRELPAKNASNNHRTKHSRRLLYILAQPGMITWTRYTKEIYGTQSRSTQSVSVQISLEKCLFIEEQITIETELDPKNYISVRNLCSRDYSMLRLGIPPSRAALTHQWPWMHEYPSGSRKLPNFQGHLTELEQVYIFEYVMLSILANSECSPILLEECHSIVVKNVLIIDATSRCKRSFHIGFDT
jgi:hypothetical protein